MTETLLLDATERYLNNEMSAEETQHFESLRKADPEVDHFVAAQIQFLQHLDKYSTQKNFKKSLQQIHSKLTIDGTLAPATPKKSATIISLFHKYKRTVSVAACIAGIVSLLFSSIISSYKSSNSKQALTPLVIKLQEQDLKTKTLEGKVNALEAANPEAPMAPIHANFRATGFMIDATGNYIVTNAHVTNEAKNQLIVENNNGEQYTAKVVYINKVNDIAIVKITDSRFKSLAAVPFAIRKKTAPLGEQIFILGFPKQEIVYTEGYVSAKNGYQMDTSYCQLVTMANAGNSGSPVINKEGEIVGVISSRETNAEGIVFAIKSMNIFRAAQMVHELDSNNNIKLSSSSRIKNMNREQQVEKLSDYVFMIKGN